MSESEPLAPCTQAFHAPNTTLKEYDAEGEALVHSCSVESLLTATSDSGAPVLGPPRSSRSVFRQGDALQPHVLTSNSSKDKLKCGGAVPRLEPDGRVCQSNRILGYSQMEEHSFAEVARQSQSLSPESIVSHKEVLDAFSDSRTQLSPNFSWSDTLPMTMSSNPIDVDSHWESRPLVRQMPILPRDQTFTPAKAVGLPASHSRTTSTDSSTTTFTGLHVDGIQPMTATDPTVTPVRPLETMSQVAVAMGLVSATQHSEYSSTAAIFQVRSRLPVSPNDGSLVNAAQHSDNSSAPALFQVRGPLPMPPPDCSSASGGGMTPTTADEQRMKSPTWVIEEVIDFDTPSDDNVREVEDSGELHRSCIAVASAAPCSDSSAGLFGECTQNCNEERGCQ